MLSTLASILFFHFDLLGFCTEYSQSTFRRIFSVIISIAQQCFILMSILYDICEHILSDVLLSQNYLANQAMKSYTAIITHLFIIIESFISRASQRKYWIVVENIQKLQNDSDIKLLAFSLWYMHGVCGTFFAEAFFMTSSVEVSFEFLIAMLILMIHSYLYQNRIHHYSLHVEIVIVHLEYVIRSLDAASKCRCINSNRCQCSGIKIGHSRILSAFQSNYLLIAESIEWINHIFGWSNAFAILFSFNTLLATINWFVELYSELSWQISTGKSRRFY